jgi:hypothetical protein
MFRVDDRIVLQNGTLRVVLLPYSEGRIESLQGAGLEFLLQPSNPKDKSYDMIADKRFQDGDCSGIDECLPTVAISSAGVPGLAVPDHGDFWSIPWTVLEPASSRSVTISADGTCRPLRFTKRLEVHPTLYACHPLLAIDPGDRISFCRRRQRL